MIPDRIIEKAIEGGWEPTYVREYWHHNRPERENEGFEIRGIALDPTFWQALGKALGWTVPDAWLYEAHRFHDLILTGGDTDAFWEEIYPSTTNV